MKIRFTLSNEGWRPYCSLLDTGVNANMCIPIPDYGKLLYYYDDESRQLLACKVEKVVVGNLNSMTQCFFWLNTPSGHKEVKFNDALFFESKEDYLLHARGVNSKYFFEQKRLREIFPNEILHFPYSTQFYPSTKRCFVFRNGAAEKASVTMRYLTFDKEGCEVCFLNTSDNLKVYLSIEDCIEDNVPAVEVVDFEEEQGAKNECLIDGTSNHDPKLVERINSAYNEKPEEFAKIVDLLALRDIDEWTNPEFYAQQPREKCRVYCQTIADNSDLRTILSYCRL